MKIYNEATEQKEMLILKNPKQLDLYVCGPTVYNHAHIGNTRPMIIFDVMRRVMMYQGIEVRHVSNYTDVDDKIIQEAALQGIDEMTLVNHFIREFEQVRRGLNLLDPTKTPRVTDYMDQIIAFINQLVIKEFAYEANGDVYFRVAKVPEYGQVSKQSIDDLVAGSRIEVSQHKENPLDFTLWKRTSEGISFESPWSKGRPGWHTECVVMIQALFEDGCVDVHGGGMDLKFPHHENEAAQSYAMAGKSVAHYWIHNQMLNLNDEKMSKSSGNTYWAKDMLETLGLNVFKWLMLSSHYRNPLNYTDELVETVRKEVDKVQNAYRQASLIIQQKRLSFKGFDGVTVDALVDTLNDDLNTANALTLIMEQVKVLNQTIRQKDQLDELVVAFETLDKMVELLGFSFTYPKLEARDFDDLCAWEDLKKEKRYQEADLVRQRLVDRGIL